jgi:hypothetical protein
MYPERFELFVANKFDHFIDSAKYLIGWAFRGQANASWLPMTSIERLAQNYSFPMENLWNRETVILRDFQRAAHQYIERVPSDNDKIEWLSLIQHYGGPTRLLDFSYSEFIAAFFAMEHATSDVAVWGINLTKIEEWVTNRLQLEKAKDIEETRKRHLALAETFIGATCDEASVLNVEPNRMHERLLIQQGLFVFPADIRRSLMDNLSSMFEIPIESITGADRAPRSIEHLTLEDILDKCIIKIILPRVMHKNALNRLARMNTTAASLFPGLDGFCRSFELHMRVKDWDDGIA